MPKDISEAIARMKAEAAAREEAEKLRPPIEVTTGYKVHFTPEEIADIERERAEMRARLLARD